MWTLVAAATSLALALAPSFSLHVCGNKACRKDGASDTFGMLHTLASTAAELDETCDEEVVVDVQAQFAASHVVRCGCLGSCGRGPNVGLQDSSGGSSIIHDVYKPASAMALLTKELGLQVPEEAGRAYLRKMYADRALRANKPQEALGLLTEALKTAGPLQRSAALLLCKLLEQRADVHEAVGDMEQALADRQTAERLRSAKAPQGELCVV
jgi:hypothetical protein